MHFHGASYRVPCISARSRADADVSKASSVPVLLSLEFRSEQIARDSQNRSVNSWMYGRSAVGSPPPRFRCYETVHDTVNDTLPAGSGISILDIGEK